MGEIPDKQWDLEPEGHTPTPSQAAGERNLRLPLCKREGPRQVEGAGGRFFVRKLILPDIS